MLAIWSATATGGATATNSTPPSTCAIPLRAIAPSANSSISLSAGLPPLARPATNQAAQKRLAGDSRDQTAHPSKILASLRRAAAAKPAALRSLLRKFQRSDG